MRLAAFDKVCECQAEAEKAEKVAKKAENAG